MARWRETAGIPPMYYPTHSTSQSISVTGAYAMHVSCQGFRDEHADGSTCRINEFRRIGHPGCVRHSPCA